MMIKILQILLFLFLPVLFSQKRKRAALEERRKSRNVTSMFFPVISLHTAVGQRTQVQQGRAGGGRGHDWRPQELRSQVGSRMNVIFPRTV